MVVGIRDCPELAPHGLEKCFDIVFCPSREGDNGDDATVMEVHMKSLNGRVYRSPTAEIFV